MWHWLYPACCRWCTYPAPRGRVFCSPCAQQFIFLDPRGRCPSCFEPSAGPCLPCLASQASASLRVGMCWEEGEAVAYFRKEVAKGRLAALAADALLVQWNQLGWELPDVILPLPTCGSISYIQRFARLLGRPCLSLLKKVPGRLPQSELPLSLRCIPPAFRLTASRPAKRLLLIDDALGTGATLQGASSTLHAAGYPHIDALFLSRLLLEDSG